jgi:DNA-binding transcriptional MerR regulator
MEGDESMKMKIKEVADLVGISVRTLHHYDEIGLLSPSDISASGYRIYSDDNLEMLQQILFFKELGFSLKQIHEMISSPTYDRKEALEMQRNLLIEKRRRLDKILATIDKTISHMKGEIEMSQKERFEGFDFSSIPYEQEAREKYGDKAVDDSREKLEKLSKEELTKSINEIYRKLANLRFGSPETDEAQEAIEEWFVFVNNMGKYSLDAFKGLGQMYVDDKRFTKNIDKFGEGLARFMCDAMAVFADKHKE